MVSVHSSAAGDAPELKGHVRAGSAESCELRPLDMAHRLAHQEGDFAPRNACIWPAPVGTGIAPLLRMHRLHFARVSLIVALSAGALAGCSSSDAKPNDEPAIWTKSSVGVVIKTFSELTYPTVSSSHTCYHWSRDAMSAEQLSFLQELELVERLPRCAADGFESRQLWVIDADTSALEYEIDSPFALCDSGAPREKKWVLPEETISFPQTGASECVECDAPCAQGTCIEGVCVD